MPIFLQHPILSNKNLSRYNKIVFVNFNFFVSVIAIHKYNLNTPVLYNGIKWSGKPQKPISYDCGL